MSASETSAKILGLHEKFMGFWPGFKRVIISTKSPAKASTNARWGGMETTTLGLARTFGRPPIISKNPRKNCVRGKSIGVLPDIIEDVQVFRYGILRSNWQYLDRNCNWSQFD